MKSAEKTSVKTLEFLTVAMHYIAIAENSAKSESGTFISDLSKILPYLYVKAMLIPSLNDEEEEILPDLISIDEYNFVQNSAMKCLKDSDIPVFIPEDQEEEGRFVLISELIADIYQDLKSFVNAYSKCTEEEKAGLASALRRIFIDYWGKKVLFVQIGLHRLISEEVPDISDKSEAHTDVQEWFKPKGKKDKGLSDDI